MQPAQAFGERKLLRAEAGGKTGGEAKDAFGRIVVSAVANGYGGCVKPRLGLQSLW